MKTQTDWYREYPILAEKKIGIPDDNFFHTKITQEAGMLLDFIPKDKSYIGVELGVNRAETSCILLHRRPKLKLILIDCWLGTPELKYVAEHHLSFFNKNRYEIIHATSKNALPQVKKEVDFVFVDAHKKNEEYAHDILNWYKKVKSGGYLFGHDIHNPNICKNFQDDDVEKVVRKCGKQLKINDIWINDFRYSWYIRVK